MPARQHDGTRATPSMRQRPPMPTCQRDNTRTRQRARNPPACADAPTRQHADVPMRLHANAPRRRVRLYLDIRHVF